MEKKASVSKNYIYNLLYQIMLVIVPIITTPYLSRVLGPENIGIYSYTYSIVSCFILFGSLGITLYAQREIAYYQNDIKNRSKVFFEVLIVRFIAIFISLIIYYFFCIKNSQYSIFYIIFLIEILSNCFEIAWLLQGMENFKRTAIRSVIIKTLSTVLIFLLVKQSSDLYKYILIHCFSTFFSNISLWKYVPQYIQKVKLKELNLKKHVKPILLLFIPQMAVQVYMVLDKGMLGMLIADKSETGYYEQASKIIVLLRSLVTSLGVVMVPRIASMYANKDDEKIKYYIMKSFNFIFFLSVPIACGLISVSDYFVPIFFGEQFDKVNHLLKILGVLILVVGLSNVTGTQFLLPTKKQKEFTIAVIIGAILNITLNLIFIPMWQSIGACIGSIIAETVVFIIEFIYCKKYIDVKMFFKNGIVKVLVGLGMTLILTFIPFIYNNYVTLIVKVIIGMFVYFGILYLIKDDFLKFIIDKVKGILFKKNKVNV